MRLLVLTVTLMVSVSEARRSARVSSIWDVILGTDAGEKQEALKTNVVKTQQSSVKGYTLHKSRRSFVIKFSQP